MNSINNLFGSQSKNVRIVTIIAMALLLITYHSAKLFGLYITHSGNDYAFLVHIQSVTRLAIIMSLSSLIMGKQKAIIAMWLTIMALIVTQFIDYFSLLNPSFSVFSYLKGFIIPTVITLIYPNNKDDKP